MDITLTLQYAHLRQELHHLQLWKRNLLEAHPELSYHVQHAPKHNRQNKKQQSEDTPWGTRYRHANPVEPGEESE